MINKQRSSQTLFVVAVVATLIAMMLASGSFLFSVFVALVVAIVCARCTTHCSEKATLAVTAGFISLSVAVIVSALTSFLLPDVFMSYWVVALIAVLPGLTIGATLFFFLTRPVSRHAVIHELEALTFFVVIVTAVALALPHLLVAAHLEPDYAARMATLPVLEDFSAQSNSTLPGVLFEYAQGYEDELSALQTYWYQNPPARCMGCLSDASIALSNPSAGKTVFALAARSLDAYLVLFEEQPAAFAALEACMLAQDIQLTPYFQFTRPSEVMSVFTVPNPFFRYVYTTDYFSAGFLPTSIYVQARTDAQQRVLAIATPLASEVELRALAILEHDFAGARGCGA